MKRRLFAPSCALVLAVLFLNSRDAAAQLNLPVLSPVLQAVVWGSASQSEAATTASSVLGQ